MSSLTNIIQDAVDMDDLIPYRMLRDRIDQYKDKVNKIVETSNENVHEVSEISAEQITFIYSLFPPTISKMTQERRKTIKKILISP